MPTITLPPRINGSPLRADLSEGRNLVIIGANGAGKTRFARRLASDLGRRSFHLSALKALYEREHVDPSPDSIDTMYVEASRGASLLRPDLHGEFERMLGLMLNEEMLSLIEHKYRHSSDRSLPTRLEQVIGRWEKVFPDNHVLIHSGSMLFTRENSTDPGSYSSAKLSDGEKSVLYYLGAVTFAPEGAVIFVDSPDMFLHPSSIRSLWDVIESSRPDCTFIYITHDLQFASTRTGGATVWVRNFDPGADAWDYEILSEADGLTDDVVMSILGARKPVLFIEGDGIHSIDARLYPLIFDDYTVKSLGGCDRVIESTRVFNSLRSFHNLEAYGIVDRDRRVRGEVEYLRGKQVLVPEVAEVENLFMLEEVVRAMARRGRRDPDEVFAKVKRTLIRLFESDLRQQALQHIRHQVKKNVEHRIDGRFANINQLETHINDLVAEINPRGMYESMCREFRGYVRAADYNSILRVYNRKTMISECHVGRLCGLKGDSNDIYISAVIDTLRRDHREAPAIRAAVRKAFDLEK